LTIANGSVDKTPASMAVFREWLKLARLEPHPGGLRRPRHLTRAGKPTA
jgi:hypothetical protein